MANDQTIGVSAAVVATAPAVNGTVAGTQSGAAVAPGAGASPAKPSGFSFRELLSDLNPLQYIPVVGAIYRAITGDEGNSDLRFAASLGTSFALGGPVGVGITVAEKVTGFDPEKIGRHLLSSLFHSNKTAPAAALPGAPPASAGGGKGATSPDAARPWTAEELAAYGVKSQGDGELSAGKLGSADVLNTLELRRLAKTYA